MRIICNLFYHSFCHGFMAVTFLFLFSVLAAKETELKETRRVEDLRKELQNKKLKNIEEDLQTTNKCENNM